MFSYWLISSYIMGKLSPMTDKQKQMTPEKPKLIWYNFTVSEYLRIN